MLVSECLLALIVVEVEGSLCKDCLCLLEIACFAFIDRTLVGRTGFLLGKCRSLPSVRAEVPSCAVQRICEPSERPRYDDELVHIKYKHAGSPNQPQPP